MKSGAERERDTDERHEIRHVAMRPELDASDGRKAHARGKRKLTPRGTELETKIAHGARKPESLVLQLYGRSLFGHAP